MRITLPLPPNMANARTHWAKKHRQQKAYRIRCTVAHPSRPRSPISPAIVDAKVYVWNLMDDDGLTARLKWPLDWLVQRDILVDDSPAHMRLGEVTQAIDRKNQRVELTVRAFINNEEVA